MCIIYSEACQRGTEVCHVIIMSIHCVYKVFSLIFNTILDKYLNLQFENETFFPMKVGLWTGMRQRPVGYHTIYGFGDGTDGNL